MKLGLAWQTAGVALLLWVLVAVFRMYLDPDMVLEFSNLMFCG